MRLNKRVVQSISTALLLLFTTWQFTTIYFTHIHDVHGAIVVHSHPFSKTSDTTHTHTLRDLQLVQARTILLPFMLFLTGLLLNILCKPIKLYFQISVSKWKTITHFVFHYRGPPRIAITIA